MGIRIPQNPGIGGLDELTDAEELFIQNLAGLSYASGDILYHDGSNITRLAKGTDGQFLKLDSGIPAWGTIAGGGDVVGPGSATNNAIARYDTTTGKLIQDSLTTIDDNGSVNIPAGQTYNIDGTRLGSADIEIDELGTATYDDVQDWLDITQSAGIACGFTLSNSRDAAELDVAAGKGFVKTTDACCSPTKSFDYAGTTNVTLTADNINYIYLDYNAGTPQVVATTDRTSIELNRHFILGRVYKNGVTLHILNSGVNIGNLARTEHERLVERDGFTYISGAVTSETGTLNLAVSAGVWYLGHNRITTNALDTSVADTFVYTHYGTASWITDNATATAIDTTHYNDGNDVLGSLTANNYGVQWVYITTDSSLYIIYGTENGTLANAEDATPPASIPTYLETMGELIAKIIVRQTGVIIDIQMTNEVTFSARGVANHNELGGLQGGQAAEYYHLTSAQHTIATQAATDALDGYATSTQITKLDGIEASADVTDTTNVTAAGALMDSEVDADLKTFVLPASTTISAYGATLVDDADASTARTTLGLVIGTDVLAEQTIGIANDNLVEMDDADAADNDYCKLTANGIEGRSYAEVLSDIGAAATAQTMHIGTTAVAINRASAALTLAGLTLTTPDIGTPSAGTLTNCDGYPTGTKTAEGALELATTAEIDTGTDTTRAMPVDQFVASKRNIRWLVFNLVEAATDCAADTNIGGDWVSPIAGTILQSDSTPFYLYATNSTAGVTGNMIVDISLGGTSIMTTNKLSFDTTEKTTTTAATPPDVTDTTIAVGDILTIDIDSIHTTAAKGLTLYLAIRE